jgi:hypothetical protein
MLTAEEIARKRREAEEAARAAGKTEVEIKAAGDAAEQAAKAEGGGADDPPPPATDPKWLKKRLEKEAEKGRRRAISDLDAKAKAKGYADADEMLAAMDAAEARRADPPPRRDLPPRATPPARRDAPQPGGGARPQARPPANDREMIALQKERDRLAKEAELARKRATRLERRMEETEVTNQLKGIASSVGIKELDFALHLFDEHNKRLTPEQREELDEKKFFEDLKTSKPFLFGTIERNGNTGTGNPPPGGPVPRTQTNGVVDMRNASQADQDKWLKERGLTRPTF